MELTQKQFYFEMFDTLLSMIFFEYCLYMYKIVNIFVQIFVFVVSLVGLGNLWLQFFEGKYTAILLFLQILAMLLTYCFSIDKNIIELDIAIEKLDFIFLGMSSDWNKISRGDFTTKEVNKLWNKYKSRKLKIKIRSQILRNVFYAVQEILNSRQVV